MSKKKIVAGSAILAVLILSIGFFVGFMSYVPLQRIRSRSVLAQKRETEETRFTETYLNKVAPEIISETLDGEKWYLANQRGKVVLVFFWSILCNDCVKEIPVMNRIHSTYKERKDFLLVGVHVFPEKDIISCYCAKKGILWPQLYESGESWQSGFSNTMGIKRTPSICIIDKEGKVRGTTMDFAGVEGKVQGLLEANMEN